ncbi:9875_t:CDS:1, partial [Racocetra fulgida]
RHARNIVVDTIAQQKQRELQEKQSKKKERIMKLQMIEKAKIKKL